MKVLKNENNECFLNIDGVDKKILEITKEDTIETFIGELYQPCGDNDMTYADKIYQSESPDGAISEYINNFLNMVNEKEYNKDLLNEGLVYEDIYKQSSRKTCASLPYRGIVEVLEKY